MLNCNISGQKITFNRLIDLIDNPNAIKYIYLPDNDAVAKIDWDKLDA